ncbi:MAG: DNA alkylation repair protein [Chitinophagaceae bacterium]|nr:DNA alkylation repair protein [Chitinophagaceae bacterium]
MTSKQILQELKNNGKDSVKKVLMAHGVKEPVYGTKIGDMKKITKGIKKDYTLSMELYNSGIYDAMYLAGLIADESKMSKKEIQSWAEKAYCSGLSEYTVPWVAAESHYGWELGMQWIDSPEERIASAGWNTLSGILALKPDNELDIAAIKKLMGRVQKEIHNAPNRVRYTMNGFIIAAGAYIKELTKEAVETARKIGEVMVDMGGTSCKVPSAAGYIKKIEAKGNIGKKKKTVKC